MGGFKTIIPPVLGSKPGPAPATMAGSTYPPAGQGVPIASAAGTRGAALEYTQKTLAGLTNELESNPLIPPSVVVVAQGNGDRVGLLIVNQGPADMFLALTPGVTFNNGIRLAPQGGFFSLNIVDDFTLCTRQWWAVCPSGSGFAYVLEEVRISYPQP